MTSNAHHHHSHIEKWKKVRRMKTNKRKNKRHIAPRLRNVLQVKALQREWFYFILMKSVYSMHTLYARLMPTPVEKNVYVCMWRESIRHLIRPTIYCVVSYFDWMLSIRVVYKKYGQQIYLFRFSLGLFPVPSKNQNFISFPLSA